MDKSGRKLTTWMLLGFAVICGAGGFVGGMVGLLIWVMPLELTVGIERFYELPNPLVPLVFFGSFLIGGAVGMITAAFIWGYFLPQPALRRRYIPQGWWGVKAATEGKVNQSQGEMRRRMG